MRPTRFASIAVVCVAGTGALGWVGASRITSPAQLAARTAAPAASLITVPVRRLTLSADVITRGTVRHRAPVKVNLAASALKPAVAGLVTLAPDRGAQLDEGTVALAVGGRPVFVLAGAVPAFRDLGLGTTGEDVRQLERALVRLGLDPGEVDGTYDAPTAAAVAALYTRAGWPPFGPTEQQRLALTAAADAASKARLARVQADLAVAQARRQVDADLRDARAATAAADARARAAAATAQSTGRGIDVAAATAARDRALADAEVTARAAALRAAQVAGAADAIAVAVSDLTAARSAQAAAVLAGDAAVQRAHDDVAAAERDAADAADAAAVARAAAERANARVATAPADVALLAEVADLARQDEANTAETSAALQARTGVQVPADELLYLDDLPRRVDDVRIKRGDPLGAELMTVSGLSLSIDASLSAGDARLVRSGAKVTVEEPDLGVATDGVVTVRAEQPGTNGVDPQKFYVEVTPDNAPASLVGASVKLTIPVQTTAGAVLAVPLSALTVGAGGTARLEVVAGATTRFVDVVPGLAAQGLVQVTAAGGGLAEDDNVVVGRGTEQPVPATGTRTTNPPAASVPAIAPSAPPTTARA